MTLSGVSNTVRSDLAISDTLRRGICGSTPFVEDVSKLLVGLDITLFNQDGTLRTLGRLDAMPIKERRLISRAAR
jgi:hypothetical protein